MDAAVSCGQRTVALTADDFMVDTDRSSGHAAAVPDRILIVDDDAGVRALYARALQLDGHTTLVAESAEAAMQVIRDGPPDVILLDLRMPFISGIGFLYRLRELDAQVPVAIITGVTDIDDSTRAEIQQLGASLHYKPVPLTSLQAIVRELVDRARGRPGSCPNRLDSA